MSDRAETSFKLSPAWRIAQAGKSLLVSGGADARYEIELEGENGSFFASLKPDTKFGRKQLDPADQRVLEQLLTADVVQPILSKPKIMRVALLGDIKALPVAKHASFSVANADKPYDIAVLVRAGQTYAAFLERVAYQTITKPHIFVDLAFHHTISIGPYVFSGETACVACLQGRVTTRWGDDEPPKAPRATGTYKSLASELVAVELDRIAHDDTSLTNRTVSWNIQDRAVKTNLLLKVPFCPICGQNKLDGNGSLAVP